MNRKEKTIIVSNLIEKAKQRSKERILAFAEDVYGTDRNTWEHLWEVPIVPEYEYDTIFPIKLESIDEEEVYNCLDNCVDEKEANAIFITFEQIFEFFPEEAREEYYTKVREGSIIEDYNAVIIYYESELMQRFEEFMELGAELIPPATQEQINQRALEYISRIFTHERMHLNTNALISDSKRDSEEMINGAELSDEDIEELDENLVARRKFDFSLRYSESLIEIMAKIIHKHEAGETIEDTVYRIIENEKGRIDDEENSDRLLLALFTLFPNDLTEWVMFGAFEEIHKNLLLEKYIEVFGENKDLETQEMLRKVGEYFIETASGHLTSEQQDKRAKMLEMIGVEGIESQLKEKIEMDELMKVIFSDEALKTLGNSGEEIENGLNELDGQVADLENEE